MNLKQMSRQAKKNVFILKNLRSFRVGSGHDFREVCGDFVTGLASLTLIFGDDTKLSTW